MKEKIAIDIDGVLLDTQGAWLSLYNERHGTNYTKKNLNTWYIWEPINCPEKEAWELFDKLTLDRLWAGVSPVDAHEVEVMKQLNEKYHVDLVTARTQESMEPVLQRLRDLYIEWQDVKVVDAKTVRAKSRYAREYKFFIDDSPYNATSISNYGGKVWLFNQPWNGDFQWDERVLDWQNIQYKAQLE